MSELPTYRLERVFAAPRALVWRTWTDPELLQRWYGPGAETTIHRFDLEVGGMWLNEMKWGGNSNFQKVVFKEIDAPQKLVWHHHSSTDEDWNDQPNAMMPGWPRLLLTTVEFQDQGEQTLVILTQIPMEASAEEIDCFTKMMAGMDKGWGAGYGVIDQVLAELMD